MSERWRERLELIDANKVCVIEADAEERALMVREKEVSGRAEMRFLVPSAKTGLAFLLPNEAITFLKNRKNADGHLLVQQDDGRWHAHVVECKATLKQSVWTKTAYHQLRWSFVRLQILADFLGLEIAARQAWIVCHQDKLSTPVRTNPALLKAPLKPAESKRSSTDAQALALNAWRQQEITDTLLGAPVPVSRVMAAWDETETMRGDVAL